MRRLRLRGVSQCDASRSRLKLWNESGTNHARIADSDQLRFRSPQHLALTPHRGTRSSLARLDKLRFGGEILKLARTRSRIRNRLESTGFRALKASSYSSCPGRSAKRVFAL